MQFDDILWIEKYRPKTIDKMVLDDSTRNRFKQILDNPLSMPHLLFLGTPGSGKTTLARILINHIIKDDSDLLILNGSDQRGITIFRTVIPEFLSVAPISSVIKIVLIDESDNLTSDAKKIFRALLEKYHTHARFILTANEDTFTPAIKSRFEVIKFTSLNKQYMLELCKNILTQENIQYNEIDIIKVIDLFYPDARKIVGTLQQNSFSKQLKLEIITIDNETIVVNKVLDLIKSVIENDKISTSYIFKELSNIITNKYVDYITVYKTLFQRLSYMVVPLKVLISKYVTLSVNSISPTMIFYEFLDSIIKESQQLQKLGIKQIE